jgi:hypothetical protein
MITWTTCKINAANTWIIKDIWKKKFYCVVNVSGTVSPSLVMMETETEQRAPLHKDVKVVVLAVCSAVALCLSLLGLCFCLKRSELTISYKIKRFRFLQHWRQDCDIAGRDTM